jgi:hypothetical protein
LVILFAFLMLVVDFLIPGMALHPASVAVKMIE